MTDNKYYTPSIEEFHVGFEYEEKSSGIWTKQIYDDISPILNQQIWDDHGVPIDTMSEYIKQEIVRIKYLDKLDIEELGFEHTGGAIVKNSLDEFTIDYKDPIGTYDKVSILYTYGSKWCLIVQGDYETPHPDWPTRFAGYIKNKSELKRILKILNINA